MLKKCGILPSRLLQETLSQARVKGKRTIDPYTQVAKQEKIPVMLLEDTEVENLFEVHRHEADLWICLEGEVDFHVEGSLVEPYLKTLPDDKVDDRELKSKTAVGTRTLTLKPMDILYIPAGQPHAHSTKSSARLLVVKLSEPEVPLSEVPGFVD